MTRLILNGQSWIKKKHLVFITMDESEAETIITALLLSHSLISGSLFTIK